MWCRMLAGSRPGQFYASPALTRLLRSTPAAQLGDRFAGRQVGTIGPSALPAPNSLIIIIGHTAGQLSRVPGASQVTSIQDPLRRSSAPLPGPLIDLCQRREMRGLPLAWRASWWPGGPAGGLAGLSVAWPEGHRSRTRSSRGCAQQMSALPSAGSSTGSGA